MPAQQLGPIRQGDAAAWTVTLRGSDGLPLTGVYAGTETLAARVWPGDDQAVSFTPAAAWLSASDGTVDLSVTGAQTAGVSPGEYRLQVRITDGGSTYSAFEATLAIAAAPGAGTAPAVYCTLDDLHRYGRHALLELQDQNDQAGWAEQRAEARQWFEDVLHACDRGANETGLGWGVRSRVRARERGRNPWLVTQLAADLLIVTRPIREAVACYALSLILVSRPELAGPYRMRANELAKTIVAEIDTNADGVGDYVIDCTAAGR